MKQQTKQLDKASTFDSLTANHTTTCDVRRLRRRNRKATFYRSSVWVLSSCLNYPESRIFGVPYPTTPLVHKAPEVINRAENSSTRRGSILRGEERLNIATITITGLWVVGHIQMQLMTERHLTKLVGAHPPFPPHPGRFRCGGSEYITGGGFLR